MPQADPYFGKYKTAGNPFVSANGTPFNQGSAASYQTAYGGELAPIVWAEDQNIQLIEAGQAILTPHGVMSIDNVKFALSKAGYNGPSDSGSLATAYGLLQAPPQPVPQPQQTAAASASLGGLSLSGGVGGLPRPLLYAGVALIAYEFLFARRRR